MFDIENISPHIPSTNPSITRDFFRNLFGFNIQIEMDSFIQLEKDGQRIGILQSIGKPNQQSFYIQVKGIDKLWENVRESLLKYNPRELFIQEYGMKEFHVVAPETNTLVFFGEAVHA